MKMASITEAKNQLSALIAKVRRGETVLITDRGRPVARLEPLVNDPAENDDGRIARLERQGILLPRRGKLPLDLILSRPPKGPKGESIVDVLIEERRKGR